MHVGFMENQSPALMLKIGGKFTTLQNYYNKKNAENVVILISPRAVQKTQRS